MTAQTQQISKLQIEEMVTFTIKNIPQCDPPTLKRFLELVNAGGTFGSMSQEQVLRKMQQVVRYIPGACAQSLLILLDLLDLKPARQLALAAPQPEPAAGQHLPFLFVETAREAAVHS